MSFMDYTAAGAFVKAVEIAAEKDGHTGRHDITNPVDRPRKESHSPIQGLSRRLAGLIRGAFARSGTEPTRS